MSTGDLRYFDPHRRATWLELFFDLIIVVALRDASEILSETHDGHFAPQQFLQFVLVFLPLWWIWAGHTIYANRFDTDSRQHRLSTLLIMFLLIVISAQISADAQDHYALAVACYCGARLIIALMYFVSKRKHHDRGGFATTVGTVFAVGAAISLSSVLLDPPWSYAVFYAGIVFDMAALVLLNRRLHAVPAHRGQLLEHEAGLGLARGELTEVVEAADGVDHAAAERRREVDRRADRAPRGEDEQVAVVAGGHLGELVVRADGDGVDRRAGLLGVLVEPLGAAGEPAEPEPVAVALDDRDHRVPPGDGQRPFDVLVPHDLVDGQHQAHRCTTPVAERWVIGGNASGTSRARPAAVRTNPELSGRELTRSLEACAGSSASRTRSTRRLPGSWPRESS